VNPTVRRPRLKRNSAVSHVIRRGAKLPPARFLDTRRGTVRINDRDGLDLNELVGVTEDRDTDQRARRSTETWRDDVPDTDEVIARLSNDEHGRLQQTLRAHTEGGEGGEEVLDG
jgi:hypothetical protein